MPFRETEFTAKIQFLSSAAMPSLVHRACLATETPSNTAYYQRAVCEALARDLDLDLDELLAALPPNKGTAAVLFGGDRQRIRRQKTSKV